jgi:hypothetical protein
MPYTHSEGPLTTRHISGTPPKTEDATFISVLLNPQDIRSFYGTDKNSQSTTYSNSISLAMQDRIVKPISEAGYHWRSQFFKPYSPYTAFNRPVTTAHNVINGFLAGPGLAIFLIIGALGIFSNPYSALIAAAIPAVKELVVGIVSLCQGLHRLRTGDPTANRYFLDAATRFALVLPLAIVSTAALPFEVVRFVTRSVASLFYLATGLKISEPTVAAKSPARTPEGSDPLAVDDTTPIAPLTR